MKLLSMLVLCVAIALTVGSTPRALAQATVSFAQPWTNHLVGMRLHRDSGLPWVAHFSDPWIDSPYQQGSPSHHGRRRDRKR